MKTFRSLLWLVPAAVFACAADGPGIHTTAADDARVIEQITGVWKADDGTELVLCERSEAAIGGAQTGCEAAHVIRSGNASHDEDVVLDRQGCGGMCWEVDAFVGGWLRRPGQPELYVAGELVTAKSDAQTAYQMPFRLFVGQHTVTGTSTTSTDLDAQMLTPDRLDAAVIKVGNERTGYGTRGPAFSLKKTASAAALCPPPEQSPKNVSDVAVDGGTADATSDATSPSDGGGDAATCTHGAPSVVCAGITCSGATPVCCEKNGVVKCVSGTCPSFDDGGSAPNGVNEVHCDDGSDCAAGEFCCASQDTTLARSMSACTKTACETPLCNADCDCPAGKTCSLGFCH